jgi:hypothetical protein
MSIPSVRASMRRRDVLVWLGSAITWSFTASHARSAAVPAKIGWLKIQGPRPYPRSTQGVPRRHVGARSDRGPRLAAEGPALCNRPSPLCPTLCRHAISIRGRVCLRADVTPLNLNGGCGPGADQSHLSRSDRARKPERYRRYKRHQHEYCKHHTVKRPDRPHHVFHFHFADGAADEQYRSHRRRKQADTQI